MLRFLDRFGPAVLVALLALLAIGRVDTGGSTTASAGVAPASPATSSPASPATSPALAEAPPSLADPAPPRAHVAPRIAVLDFELVEAAEAAQAEAAPVDPWSFGLADFLSAELAARGLPVYERGALRAVLAERALEGSGLVAEPQAVQAALPQLRFLVRGRIEALPEQRFRLSISALDTARGTLASEDTVEGRYPDELAGALEKLAESLLRELGEEHEGPAPAPRPAPPGFTRNPDVAVQFYKGLDHFVHGRPEFAAEYFRQARLADRGFWVAAAWRMRAYDALGLRDLAHFVRGTLLDDPEGRRVFQLVAPSLVRERGSRVVSVPRSHGASERQHEIEAQIGAQLASEPGIEVFSAAWIRALADELDLRLSEEIAPYPIEEQAWLAADLVLRVDPREDAGEPGPLRLQLIDAMTGARRAQVEVAAEDDWRAAVPRLVAQLVTERDAPHSVWGGQALRPLDYPMPPGDIATYSLAGYAYLLRDFAEHPGDPRRLTSHAEMHGLHSHAEHEPGIYDREWGYLELLWQRLLAGVDPADPDAPNWLSLALWNLRLHGFHNGDGDSPNWWYNRGKQVPPLAEHFAPLLERYPESLAALCVRYSVALEHAMWGRHDEAAEILLELAERPHEAGDLVLDYGVTANLYLMASIEAERVGRGAEAAGFAERAQVHAERFAHFREPQSFRKNRPIGGRDHPVEPVVPAVVYAPPRRGGHPEGYFYVTSMPKTVFIDGRVRFMREAAMNRAIALAAGAGQEAAGEPALDVQYRAAIALQGEPGVEARLAYLRRVVTEIEAGNPVSMAVYFGRPMDTLFPWLHEQLPAGPGRRAFEALVHEFVDAGRERGYLRDHLILMLFAAAGMDDAVLAIAEAAEDSRHTGDRSRAVVAKAGVVTRRAGPRAAARYLAVELVRFESEFETSRDAHYLDLVHACGQAHEAAGEFAAAVAVYEAALAAPIFEGYEAPESKARAQHHRASIRYRIAGLEAQRGNALAAAELLKQVIESAETHPDWLIHYSGHKARSAGTLTLYRAALRDLSEVRSPSS